MSDCVEIAVQHGSHISRVLVERDQAEQRTLAIGGAFYVHAGLHVVTTLGSITHLKLFRRSDRLELDA
jgi:hypothetical protein